MELLGNIPALLARSNLTTCNLASKVYYIQAKAWDQREQFIMEELQNEGKKWDLKAFQQLE